MTTYDRQMTEARRLHAGQDFIGVRLEFAQKQI